MILEMLAGDELPDKSVDTQIATGFLVRNRFPMERNVWLNSTVEHTAKAFLGLTINCAQCHDHKFDPITQKEYYEFRHFFEAYDVRRDNFTIPGTHEVQQLARTSDSRPNDKTLHLSSRSTADPGQVGPHLVRGA